MYFMSTHVEPCPFFPQQKVCLARLAPQDIKVVRDLQRSAFRHLTTKASPHGGKEWQESQNIFHLSSRYDTEYSSMSRMPTSHGLERLSTTV